MDTCGQERFKSLNKNFYSSSDGILFVFDVTQETSFKNIDNWLKESNNYAVKFKKILIANKIDLENIREVKKDMIENYAKKEDMIFFETSAKTGENVEESFNKLAELIISDMTENEIKEKSEKAGLKKIGKRKKCC
jgi:small GTP-binding protein